ncbi:thrombospondin type 3 repeat-containing protein [Oceanicoccus sagamiensis]|uniref:PKD/Chitinase domain-containing protein n=1 Tax=Oceanicoccus sagamiensis TaxID=716816 RepID=A0A1X9N6B7_9GAMM|nr:thrombospondin type 3 repeat-containing protein [Oceanicoccus sagamiensis]ARN72714.1 hypothetical protein BST96_00430 [Oceanicoccus sagamiensis]
MTPLSPPCQKTLLATLIPLLLSGCGGGSSVDPAEPEAPLSGVFIDSPVSNINYQTKTLKGVTDSNGAFQYMEGEVVTFSIGEIEVGRSQGQEQISPLDLVGTEDSENIEVINIARLLQSLDADGNPDNGIEITEQAKDNALTPVDFAADNFDEQVINLVASSGSETTELISPKAARNHLEASLAIIPVDSDNDGVRDSEDEYPDNSFESKDTDGDGVGDNADAFPTNKEETVDSDGDNVGDNSDFAPFDASIQTICDDTKQPLQDRDNAGCFEDSDGDGVNDGFDAFPNDASETTDSDGDGVGDNADAFPNDAGEILDSDGDGVGDNADALPNDNTETTDSDGDLVGDNADAFPGNPGESVDTDKDGVGDNADAFPNDMTETADTDGDGVGDNADAFPTNAEETVDSDGDNVGDNSDFAPFDASIQTICDDTNQPVQDRENAGCFEDSDGDGVNDGFDAFPNDASETTDSDGDGVGDNADAFPNDAGENLDSDGDMVGDNADAFPYDNTETTDSDGDLVGDNADAFPDDATETTDTDGDDVGDNADAFPHDPSEWADSDGDSVGDNGDYAPNDASIQTLCQAEPSAEECRNDPPVAVISTSENSPAINTLIELDASNSSDPEGESITWRWSLLPANTTAFFIEDDETEETSVNVGNLSGTLIVSLEVSDGVNTTSTQVPINVTNATPVVEAGADQNALINQTIDLFGSATDNETDSESLNYRWSVIPENAGTFGNTASAITTFTFGGDPGGFTLRLTADDGETENFDEILVQSCAATPGTYSMEGTVKTVAPIGESFAIAVEQQVQWGFDIDSTVTGLVSAGDISGNYATDPRDAADGARFVVWAIGGVGTSPVVPILFNGTTGINSTTMTVDGTNVTGGSIEFFGNAGTGQQATILIDFDAGTFDIWSGTTSFGGDKTNIFYGAGGTINTVTRPNCVGQN